MKKLFIALAISTATLAASTLWLAREVAAERAGNPAASAKVAITVAEPATQHAPAHLAPKMEIPAQHPAAAPDAPAGDPGRAQRNIDFAREFLDRIATPEGRAWTDAEGRKSLATTYPSLDMERLGFSREERERFLDLKAEVTFDYAEKMSRCRVTPGCEAMPTSLAASSAAELRLQESMGAEKFGRLKLYEDSFVERRTVTRMRGMLPDNAYLSDDAAERLITALAEERRKYRAQNTTSELAPDGFGTTDGMLLYMAQSMPEESLSSAEEYSRRMRRQAAAILDRRQLEEFDQMQRRLLMGLREQIAENEARKSVH